MPVDAERIARMERELAEAKRQLLEENGRKFEVLMRLMTEEEREAILGRLTDRSDRILFGLELPEEPKRRGRPAGGGERPAKSGGDQACPICGKAGLTERGLKLHLARMHKAEGGAEAS
jgi:hypothetical protein